MFAKLVAILLLTTASALARAADCSASDAEVAESAADTLKTWNDVLVTFLRFRECDDGAIAEGLSEAIARLFVDRWDRLNELQVALQQQPDFEQFVLRHIDATLDGSDLLQLRQLAETRCPAQMDQLCKSIARQSSIALTDQ
jgi:hypothetical protein